MTGGRGDGTQELSLDLLPAALTPNPSLLPIPLSEGATGASTVENTASLASSMSCCENCPDWAQPEAFAKVCSVSAGHGSLGDPENWQVTSPTESEQHPA